MSYAITYHGETMAKISKRLTYDAKMTCAGHFGEIKKCVIIFEQSLMLLHYFMDFKEIVILKSIAQFLADLTVKQVVL